MFQLSDNRYQLRNRFTTQRDVADTRDRALRRHRPFNFVDEAYDLEWAKQHLDSDAPNSYYDYFFGAADIKVYVAELADDPEFGNIPIHNIGFNVEQQKAPIYGYWSYTYDTVARGVRLVSGQFTLVTKYPNYMKRLLTKAASNRADRHQRLSDDYPAPQSWREDDENIERYWGRHLDPSAIAQQGSEWSIHPPFSFVIVYGVQHTSVESHNVSTRYAAYESDNPLMKDTNQRLVEGFNAQEATRIVLDGCELTSVERMFSAESPFMAEVYTFFGRDIIIPTPNTKTTGRRGGGGGTSVVR